ncbi:hypothetical protein BVRB_8g198980 [Beta vulgaris subsp. vulgaris]|nr:hypothetical protein BVRB_8g198980 [Beta vulgaris subsp. vulgaris]
MHHNKCYLTDSNKTWPHFCLLPSLPSPGVPSLSTLSSQFLQFVLGVPQLPCAKLGNRYELDEPP